MRAPDPLRRRNPLRRTREPVPLPEARSRAALGLAVAAAEGVFALQVCAECGAVQYPPRDVCGVCLSGRLRWRPVPETGRLVALTTTRISGERHFRERTPLRTGIVALDAGPRLIAHLDASCAVDGPVHVALRLDHAGRGAVFARAAEGDPGPDASRGPAAGPGIGRALVVDARASTAPALARALAQGGSPRIFMGLSETWKPLAQRAALAGIAGLEIVPLDVTDASSVRDLAGQIGDKVEILIDNTARVRPGGLLGGQGGFGGQDPVVARETYEMLCLGLSRLAQAFGPVMRARAADDPRAATSWVNLVSVWALAAPPGWASFGATQAARRALSLALRQEMRPAGIRVVDVLMSPIEDEWHQALPPPKVRPETVAAAVLAALADGREEVVVGDIAKEIHARWAQDPRLLRHEGAR